MQEQKYAKRGPTPAKVCRRGGESMQEQKYAGGEVRR